MNQTTEGGEPEVDEALAMAHGLTAEEYRRILDLIGRTPSFTELGIFSAMWNEHCSYKSSKIHLRTLPTDGPQVILGPGENAGVVDIGDGQAVVFKMESHNHPSQIEPKQGAATGVGGILRDVFTMGARPVAAMNALSFGDPTHPKTRSLVAGAVAGIGGYGNCFGVPTVGGEVRFHPGYDGNCLVNALAAGIADADRIFTSAASGVGTPLVYVGAKTGRDGVGGATMASAGFDAEGEDGGGGAAEDKRPTVQVGDPFIGKRLLEACLELMASDAVIAIQDMGAAGLTCSAVEMGDKGDLGVELELDSVPCREEGMGAYEIMLSESQERMLMALRPDREAEARAIFEKWDLDFAVVGRTIAEGRFIVRRNGAIRADLPLKALSGEAPEYDRPRRASPAAAPLTDTPEVDPVEALKTLIAAPNFCSRRWVWEQYDSTVMADTAVGPGSDAAVVRVHGTDKALAFTADVTPRYCKANPVEGGKQAVAEAYRNLCATGATPLATTDNLNFGNPENPEIMGQFADCVQGIGAACSALDMPIVSGNVSLYNETGSSAIPPTPTIGAVGLLERLDHVIPMAPKEGDILLLIGRAEGHLGCSALLWEMLQRDDGDAPPVNLQAEKQAGELIRDLKAGELITSAHDLSDGGLAVAAAEMSLATGVGVVLEGFEIEQHGLSPTAWFFGEDQGRYLVACPNEERATAAAEMAATVNVPLYRLGHVGGTEIVLGETGRVAVSELAELHENGFARIMGEDEEIWAKSMQSGQVPDKPPGTTALWKALGGWFSPPFALWGSRASSAISGPTYRLPRARSSAM